MYNIHLVFTRHSELGECNSYELYHIIECINPNVIFEEIPPTYFDKYYVEKSCSNLESNTISKYIKNHEIDHVPVDSDEIPSEEFWENHKRMHERIEGLMDIHGFAYRNSVDSNKIRIEREGFKYLNSIDCSNLNDEIYDAMENGIQQLNDNDMLRTFEEWRSINERRETKMLDNIYEYSQTHSYDRAVFTIGAAHRKSIIEKISEYENDGSVQLSWTLVQVS